MAFGDKVKQLREDRNMAQEDLAAELCVSRTAVSKWGINKGYSSIDTLVAIQKLFGVSVDYLIGEEDIEDSLVARQKESRKLFWCAVACFAAAVLCAALSLVVYNAGHLPWVLPLRVIGVIGVLGYFAFALASKAKYQPKPKAKKAVGCLIASRVILLLIIVGVIVMYLIQAV